VIWIARLKRQVKANVERLSNYTCVETIERARRKNDRQPLRHADSIRVEVAVSGRRDSWPGADQFEERDLTQMIGGGTVSTGDFVSDLRAVLVEDAGVITYRGEETLRGRPALRWDFSIPVNLSGWTVTHGGASGVVGRRGSFWAEPNSLDLLRLESNAQDFPPGLPVAALQIVTDYARVDLGGQPLILPQRVELLLTDIALGQSRNVIEFSHCRQFSAQASLRFDAPGGTTPTTPRPPVQEIRLPAGLRLQARLDRALDSRALAVGDPLSATLDSPASGKPGPVVPKGAVLRGRIRRFDPLSEPRDHFIVGFEFTDLEFPGHHARFFGEMEEIAAPGGMKTILSSSSVRSRTFQNPAAPAVYEASTETFSTLPIPGVGTFLMEGRRFILPEGMRIVWRTVELKR
jgi:hypothetical protein